MTLTAVRAATEMHGRTGAAIGACFHFEEPSRDKDYKVSKLRRTLLGCAAGSAVLPWTALAGPSMPRPPSLEWGLAPAGDFFVLATSPRRDIDQLQAILRQQLLAALPKHAIEQVWAGLPEAIQPWMLLETERLHADGLTVEQALAALGDALEKEHAPMRGVHALRAWAFDGVDASRVHDIEVRLSDGRTVSMRRWTRLEYTQQPPPWRDWSRAVLHVTTVPDADRDGTMRVLQEQLQAPASGLPSDIAIQMAPLGERLQPVDTLFVMQAPSD